MSSLFYTPTSTSFAFPASLTEKYRPRTIDAFVGLEKPKRFAANFAANPYPSAWRFIGASGTGKTTLALAIADAINAELHHVPSQECNLSRLEDVIRTCNYVPMAGCKFHLILIDEADQMTYAAQLYLLSKLDATGFPPNTIFIFTCNETDRLETRFLSRSKPILFSTKVGMSGPAAALLASIWDAEAPIGAERPDFARIVKDSNINVRTALGALETELLCA